MNFTHKITPPNMPTIHHIIPRKRKGLDTDENLRACCKHCNELLGWVDDCPGAMQCALLIVKSNKINDVRLIAQDWPKEKINDIDD